MRQFLSLQYLRAAAALSVVIFHFTHQSGAAEPAAFFARGQFGVDLFFVLSGFIMWTSTSGGVRPASFFARRIARVAPLYWIGTLAAAFVATEPSLAIGLAADAEFLLASLLFIPTWSPTAPDVVAPLLTVGWTLNIEMAFYALFAAGLFFAPRVRFAVVGGTLALLAVAGLAIETRIPLVEAYTNSAVIEFVYGMALARLYAKGELRGRGGLLIAGGAMLALVAPVDLDWRGLTFGPAAAAIVAGCLILEERIAARPVTAAKLLGDASYSLYLTHGMALAAMAALARAAGLAPSAGLIVVEIAVASAASIVIYLAVERPLTRLARRIRFPAPIARLPAH